ncbi:AraC family transcriptional regulator [Maricurvus nonylphenolicus]|uniref:AraC family transcriptional regulator n=1 Tax=Maricurvus nonylphenolicus TaxID=1008307 RepID=UPI0036F393CA
MLQSQLTTMGGYVLGIANAIEQQGLNADKLLQSAGIEQRPKNDPLDRLPHDNISRLFDACVKATDDQCFGLSASRYLNIANFHAVGCSLTASNSLWDMLLRLKRYAHIVSQLGHLHVEETDTEVRLVIAMEAVACYETQDTAFSFIVRLMRSLYKNSLHPNRVELVRPLPSQGAEQFSEFFRSQVSFGHPQAVFSFNKAEMQAPLAGANPELAHYNDNLAKRYLTLLDRSDIARLVKGKMLELMSSGDISKKLISQQLNMSVNNLQSKLAKQNTSYSALYDSVRKDIACDHLKQQHMSICEISYLVGFSDTSNFTRAFKRWQGVSPSEYRENKATDLSFMDLMN